MNSPIDKNLIRKVALHGDPCPTCGDTSNLSARLGENGNTCVYHNKCGHLQHIDILWSDYVDNCIKGGWIRYGIDGTTLIDPTTLKPGMERAVYQDPAAKKKEGCFIASAVYGSSEADEVQVLRGVRDQVLLRSRLGTFAVTLYYRYSPPIANLLSRNAMLRSIVRVLLDRVVRSLERDR